MDRIGLPLRTAPPLEPGEVHVWFVQPGTLALPAAGDVPRTGQDRLQQQFLLRLLLGSYLGIPGRALRLARTATGKPHLVEPAGGLQFSQSHSGNWLSIALARDLTPGIDLESASRTLRAEALARRWFAAAEADRVAAASDPRTEFLRRWTAREAMIKAIGDTLATSLGGIELDALDADRPLRLPKHWPTPEHWSVLRPETPAGLEACLACCGKPRLLRSFLLFTRQSN